MQIAHRDSATNQEISAAQSTSSVIRTADIAHQVNSSMGSANDYSDSSDNNDASDSSSHAFVHEYEYNADSTRIRGPPQCIMNAAMFTLGDEIIVFGGLPAEGFPPREIASRKNSYATRTESSPQRYRHRQSQIRALPLGRAKQVGELSQVLFLLDLITQVVDIIMQSSQWDTQRLQLSAALPSQSARPISRGA